MCLALELVQRVYLTDELQALEQMQAELAGVPSVHGDVMETLEEDDRGVLKICLYKGDLVMILYHGSNMEIRKPKIIPSKRLLDFGTGFYLTSDYMQAKKWAERTTARREEGTPVISVFYVADDQIRMLNTLMFDSANTEWLKYISANRTDRFTADSYDIVIGPVANDQAVRTVNNYLKGYFSEEIAIQLLLPQKLKDQYAFKTELALTALKFEEAKHP